jgi:hypothetical protein
MANRISSPSMALRRIHALAGKVRADYWNDRAPDRAERIVAGLNEIEAIAFASLSGRSITTRGGRKIMTKSAREVIKLGLAQIPVRDLRRLLKYIDDGKPLLLNGYVYDRLHSYGCPMWAALPVRERDRFKNEMPNIGILWRHRILTNFHVDPEYSLNDRRVIYSTELQKAKVKDIRAITVELITERSKRSKKEDAK